MWIRKIVGVIKHEIIEYIDEINLLLINWIWCCHQRITPILNSLHWEKKNIKRAINNAN